MDHLTKDMTCGSISGFAICVSGYTFDTLKTRMQMNSNVGMLSTFKSIIKN